MTETLRQSCCFTKGVKLSWNQVSMAPIPCIHWIFWSTHQRHMAVLNGHGKCLFPRPTQLYVALRSFFSIIIHYINIYKFFWLSHRHFCGIPTPGPPPFRDSRKPRNAHHAFVCAIWWAAPLPWRAWSRMPPCLIVIHWRYTLFRALGVCIR